MSIMPVFRIVNRYLGDVRTFPALRESFLEDPANLAEVLVRLADVARDAGEVDDAGYEAARAAIDGVASVLDAFPGSHQAALLAVIRNALERDVAMQLAWQPGYDNELTVTEFQDQEDSVCGVTVLVKSRHASDPRLGVVASP